MGGTYGLCLSVFICVLCTYIEVAETTIGDVIHTGIEHFQAQTISHTEVGSDIPVVVHIGCQLVLVSLVVFARTIQICVFQSVVDEFAWIRCNLMIILCGAAGVIDVGVELV